MLLCFANSGISSILGTIRIRGTSGTPPTTGPVVGPVTAALAGFGQTGQSLWLLEPVAGSAANGTPVTRPVAIRIPAAVLTRVLIALTFTAELGCLQHWM